MCKLAQIFYGRSRDGYGILGTSPSGRPFVGFVAQLCRAVGSPDRPGDIRPFLMSKREGSHIIMIRVCRGAADPTGRLTLFFHALVAPLEALSSANLDAFVLAEKGMFLSALPESLEDVEVPASTGKLDSSPSGVLCYPAFISSGHPLDLEVRRTLGRETLSRSWATYSYRSLEGFDLCVHSSYASSPTHGNKYTFENGAFVPEKEPIVVPPMPQPQKPSCAKSSSGYSFMLKASLFVNVVLVVGLVALFALYTGKGNGNQSPQAQKPTPPPEMTKDAAFAKWGSDWEAEFRHKLWMAFEQRLGKNQRILDFEKEMAFLDPYYTDYKSGKAMPPTPKTLSVYATLKAYVSFFETEIMITKQERERQ